MDKYTNVIQHMLRDTSNLQKIEKRKKKSKTLLQKNYHNPQPEAETLPLSSQTNPSTAPPQEPTTSPAQPKRRTTRITKPPERLGY